MHNGTTVKHTRHGKLTGKTGIVRQIVSNPGEDDVYMVHTRMGKQRHVRPVPSFKEQFVVLHPEHPTHEATP